LCALQQQASCDVLAVCETWLDETVPSPDIALPGFKAARLDRHGSRGGGVCLYYNEALPCRPRADLHVSNVECCWVELSTKSASCLIGCIYRPPGQLLSYWESFEAMLVSASRENKDIVLCGDFNVDLCRGHSQSSHLTDIMSSVGLTQHVTQPTRADANGSTSTLDLVYSSLHPTRQTTATPVPFSDHFAVT